MIDPELRLFAYVALSLLALCVLAWAVVVVVAAWAFAENALTIL